MLYEPTSIVAERFVSNSELEGSSCEKVTRHVLGLSADLHRESCPGSSQSVSRHLRETKKDLQGVF